MIGKFHFLYRSLFLQEISILHDGKNAFLCVVQIFVMNLFWLMMTFFVVLHFKMTVTF